MASEFSFSAFLDWLHWAALKLPLRFLGDNDILSWKWFLSCFAIVIFCTLLFSPNLKRSWRLLRAHLRSRRAHQEFSLDMKFMLFKVFYDPLKLALYGGFFVKATKYFESATLPLLQVGVPHPPILLNDTFGSISLALFTVMIWDFSYFLFHYISHQWGPMWDLHAVHHRARYLNPFTKFRIHPLSSIIDFFMSSLMVGVALAVYKTFVWHPQLNPVVSPLQLSIVFIYFWGHLRHSQYWLSFGKYFSYIIISPAMHQIHHSRRPEHHGKNLGVIFAVWDYMFGTLYIPQKKEKTLIGPDPLLHRQPWTFRQEMFEPVRQIKDRWVRTFPSRPAWAFALVFCLIVGSLYTFSTHLHRIQNNEHKDNRVLASDSGE